jgi:hypothetical protein
MAANTIAEARAFNIGRLLNTSMLPIKSMMNTMMAAMRTGSNQAYSDGKNMFEPPTDIAYNAETRRAVPSRTGPAGHQQLPPFVRTTLNQGVYLRPPLNRPTRKPSPRAVRTALTGLRRMVSSVW